MEVMSVPRRTAVLRAHALIVLLCASIGGPVALAQEQKARNPDPWMGLNRGIYGFNKFLDRWVMKPVAKGYAFVMPDPMQRGVSNFFDNLGTPWVAANQFLQGKPRRGLSDLARFGINTTVGVAGFFDVATPSGIAEHNEDFGQTLAVWGLPPGPYLVIPLLGPSTVTTAGGRFVDSYGNPIRYVDDVPTRNTLLALYFIDKRARLLDAEKLISGDEYLFVRDAYLQSRGFEIHDGILEDDPFLDDEFGFEEE